MSIHLLPVLPVWLIVLLAAGLMAALVHGSLLLRRKQVPGRWLLILGGLRLAAVIVFVLALLQPVLSYTTPVEQLAELAVLIDTSKSMSLPAGDGKDSRLQHLLPALQSGDLAAALRDRYRLHWFSFDRSAAPLGDGVPADLKAAGPTTRYGESLRAAYQHLRAGGVTPERVLLVSDGNDHGSADPVATARRLGLAVDALAPAPATGAGSSAVEIADVQSTPRVLLGSETHFRVALRRPAGQAPERRTLHLAEDGKDVWKQAVVVPAGRTELSVPVAYRPTSVGSKRYAFRLDDAGKPYPLSVDVVDGKNQVLILEDNWRWEFKFLRRVLEDDPSFRFTALLARGGGTYVQFGSPDRRVNLVGFPQSRAELEGFDTIILGDVNPKRWPRGLAAALGQLVADEGKSLVVIAGPNLANLAEVPALNRLLPVELTRQSARPVGGPVAVRVSAEGVRSPFFFPSSTFGASGLPPLDQVYAPLRKRPAATVLLEAAKLGNAHGNLIVMAEHTVGRGRVLYVGTDTLWKWQTLAPAGEATTPYALFWQQALRALAPTRSNLGGVSLWLQADHTRSEVGRPVVVRAEIQSDRPLTRPRVQASVVLPDGHSLPLAFAVDPARPGQFRAEFEAGVPGPYRIKAAVLAEGKGLADGSASIQVDPARGEEADTGVDRANLERIATATGGKLLDPARPETWPDPGDRPRETVLRERTLDLWNNFTLLLILCGLLGTDWMLRLLRGYV